MTYFINPMWFYWIHVVNTLKVVLDVASIIVGIIFVATLITEWVYGMDFDREEKDKKKLQKALKLMGISLSLMLLAIIFIPSRQTLIEMMVAKQLTVQNVGIGIETIKSAVDYIVQALSEIK